jgi:hypothetical protein
MEIKLNLTIEDVNAIISTLGMLPFNQSAAVIGKIREQAIPQVQAAEAAAKAAAENSDSANDVETSADSEGGEAA